MVELDKAKWRDVFIQAIENAKRKHKWIKDAENAMETFRCDRSDGLTVYFPTLSNVVEVTQGAIINNVPDIVVTGENDLTYNDDKLAQIAEKTINHYLDENDLGSELDKFTISAFASSNGTIRVNDDLTLTTLNHENMITEPCTDYAQMDWVAIKHWISRGVYVDKWGEPTAEEYKEQNNTKGYLVYEIWDKKNKKVWHISDASDEVLECEDPAIDFEGFYPFPKPYFEGCKTQSFEPVVGYNKWQRLDYQIQKLAKREEHIIESIRAGYFFDQAVYGDLSQIEFTAEVQGIGVKAERYNTDNQLDINKAISYWDNTAAIITLNEVRAQREELLQKVYQTTGISNEMQSISDSRETATAQKIKHGWGSSRLEGKRRNVHRLIRDLIRLYAQAIYQVVGVDEIAQISGENVEQHIIQQMNDGQLMKYAIDIETQTTLAINEKNERAEKLESLGSLSQMVSQLGPLVDSGKMTMPVMVSLMKMITESYPSSQVINDELDSLVESFNLTQQMNGQIQQMGQQIGQLQQTIVGLEQENVGLKGQLQNATQIDLQKKILEGEKIAAETELKLNEAANKAIEGAKSANEQMVSPDVAQDEFMAMQYNNIQQ